MREDRDNDQHYLDIMDDQGWFDTGDYSCS